MHRPPKRFYEFDSFRIDVEERRLLRGGGPVPLTAKVFDLLLVLVESSGHTLEKAELLDKVWADAFVEEGSLNRNISTLRRVLGDDFHKPRFIKTVPKRGYRFEGDIREFVEEEETLVVEKRTNYRIAFHEETRTQSRGKAKVNISSRRFAVAAAAAFALLSLGLVLALDLAKSEEASFLVSAMSDANSGTKNEEALELYKKGRELWQNRSVEGLHQATSHLERAVALDPQFALAHAALADAYAFDVQDWRKAETEANEAIRLDPGLGQPHATIGFVRMFWEWKLREAEPHFQKAIRLSPDYATAHQWYSLNLAAMARGGEALAEMKRALELEPSSVAINADLCQVLNFSRKYDQAISQCRKTLEMDPNFLNARLYLYEAYTAKGMYAEAVNEYLRADEVNMGTLALPAHIENLKTAFAAGGIRAFWRARIEMLKKPLPTDAYAIARYHLRLGEHDEAIRYFRHAYENHDFGFVFLADPAHSDLLQDPRYIELGNLLLNKPVDQ
ncbi:MAG TPA: winged helix-turn-helix domain-containing protein [Pyrinomonadaceae bacterium]|nr:winged helix-turn-helix domain-containing protein [Pyrinomonadaceae bacterium]